MPGQSLTTKTNKRRRHYKKYRLPRKTYMAVQRMINGDAELKAHDVFITAASIYNALPTIQQLTSIGQGPDDNEVIGRKLRLMSVNIRLSFSKGTLPNLGTCRIILFQDTDQGSAAPVVNDVLQNPNTVSQYQYNTRSRIDVLYDKIINLDNDDPIMEVVIGAKKFRNKYIQWFGTPVLGTPVVAKGHLYLMLFTDNNFVLANPLYADLNSRVTYYDS